MNYLWKKKKYFWSVYLNKYAIFVMPKESLIMHFSSPKYHCFICWKDRDAINKQSTLMSDLVFYNTYGGYHIEIGWMSDILLNSHTIFLKEY